MVFTYRRKWGRRRKPYARGGGWGRRTGGFKGIEMKFMDTGKASTAIAAPTDWSGAEMNPATPVFAMNAMAEGTGESNRIGRLITMHEITVRGTIHTPSQVNQTAADTSPQVFVALVMDMQCNGAQLNSEDVYTNPLADAGLNTIPQRNLQHIRRFKVLRRLSFRVPQPPITYDGTNIEQAGNHVDFIMRYKFPAGGQKVIFDGTTAAIASISDVSLQLVCIVNNNSTAPNLIYNSRLRYTG